MKKLIGFIVSAALPLTLFFTGVVATPATATSVTETNGCGSAGCSVTFEYTANLQTWPVPPGITSVRFEAYGAAGGGGAAGGLISGTLHSLPSTLYIMVGGAGSIGNEAVGGFNGGAKSGASNNSSGSGGGASDIRTSSSRLTKVVISGGGGGKGSNGGIGGLGGGLVGGSGESGTAGAGGKGGSQYAGGVEGEPTRQFGGVAGIEGQGGVGGSANGMTPEVGGGGGGGGYYGGGGGTGAGDPQYTGSGGGGGSSFASESKTSGVTHQQGVRSGHGLVVLRYGATPTVASFGGTQTSADSAEFNIDFGAPVAGLAITDFEINSTSGCRIDSLSGGPDRYTLAVSNCVSSPARLTLIANSAVIDETGPALAETFELAMSIGEPQFSLAGNPSVSTGDFNFDVQHSARLEPLGLSDFEISGCAASIKPVTAGTRLVFQDCADGTVQITLKANALRDAFGNAGPNADITRSVRIDGSRPTLRLESLASTFGAGGFEQVRVKLIASEPVSVRVDSLSVSPSGKCRLNSVGSGSERTLTIEGCANGKYQLVIPVGAVADQSGWFAPTSRLTWPFEVTRGLAVTPVAPINPSPNVGPTPPPQIAPWIPIDLTTDGQEQPSEPIVIAGGAAGASDLEEADLTIWLVPGGLSLLFLLIALLLMRRRKRAESAEDDGAATVKKHSVFRKPADSLR